MELPGKPDRKSEAEWPTAEDSSMTLGDVLTTIFCFLILSISLSRYTVGSKGSRPTSDKEASSLKVMIGPNFADGKLDTSVGSIVEEDQMLAERLLTGSELEAVKQEWEAIKSAASSSARPGSTENLFTEVPIKTFVITDCGVGLDGVEEALSRSLIVRDQLIGVGISASSVALSLSSEGCRKGIDDEQVIVETAYR